MGTKFKKYNYEFNDEIENKSKFDKWSKTKNQIIKIKVEILVNE